MKGDADRLVGRAESGQPVSIVVVGDGIAGVLRVSPLVESSLLFFLRSSCPEITKVMYVWVHLCELRLLPTS